MPHVFISYVHDNEEDVQCLCRDLEAQGVNVWLDRNDIQPGVRWRQAIRRAINDGAFFIACFCTEYSERDETFMNAELTWAISRLQNFSTSRVWFIPVKLNECEIPDRDIGAGETLQDLQYIELYKDWNAAVQRILATIQPIPPNVQSLISSLRSDDVGVRIAAADALVEIAHNSAIPALIEALKDENDSVRKSAVNALGNIGDPTVIPALIEVLKHEDDSVRQRAASALRKLGKSAVPALIEALKDKGEDGEVRGFIAAILGDIGAPATEPALMEALKDENASVRFGAVIALGNIGDPTAIPALIEALKDKGEDAEVRGSIASALGIALGNIGDPTAIPVLIEVLKDKGEDAEVRSSAAFALGCIGDPATVPALIEALKDENDSVRKSAALALRGLGTPEAMKAAEKCGK